MTAKGSPVVAVRPQDNSAEFWRRIPVWVARKEAALRPSLTGAPPCGRACGGPVPTGVLSLLCGRNNAADLHPLNARVGNAKGAAEGGAEGGARDCFSFSV